MSPRGDSTGCRSPPPHVGGYACRWLRVFESGGSMVAPAAQAIPDRLHLAEESVTGQSRGEDSGPTNRLRLGNVALSGKYISDEGRRQKEHRIHCSDRMN